MPKLACHACGRQLYSVAPNEASFAEERRCPRCGAQLALDRRSVERRQRERRVNPAGDPGPPTGMGERRVRDRRAISRRTADGDLVR